MKVNVVGIRKVEGKSKAGESYRAKDLYFTHESHDCDGLMAGSKRLYDNMLDKFPVGHMIKVGDTVNLDFDTNGYLVGIEILSSGVASSGSSTPVPPKSGLFK